MVAEPSWSSGAPTNPSPPDLIANAPTIRVVLAENGELAIPQHVLLYRSSAYFMSQLTDTAGRPLIVEWHHRRWLRLLERNPRLVFMAPRDHSKSWTVIVFLLWLAWRHNRDPETGFLIEGRPQGVLPMLHMTSTIDVSLVQAQVMQELVVSNQHLFGDMTPAEALGSQRSRAKGERRRWSARHARFTNGADLIFKSWGSTTRGLHPKHTVLDDVLREETTATEYQRTKVWRRFMGAVEPMVPPDGQLVVTGTAFHFGDLLHRLRKTPGWEYRKYRAVDFDANDGEGQALWPGRYSVAQLRQKQLTDPLMFSREYQNDPRDDASSLLPYRLTSRAVAAGAGLRFLERLAAVDRDTKREYVVLAGDFALSQSVGADFCVVMIVRFDVVTGERRLLHAVREQGLSLDAQVQLVQGLTTRFAVDMGVVEENAFQKWLKAELDKHAITRGRITGHTTGIEKQTLNEGVPMLVPVLEQGAWVIPSGVDETGTVIDERARLFAATWQAECNAFGWVDGKLQGAGEHDDTVMTTWLVERAIRLLQFATGTLPWGAVRRPEDLGMPVIDRPIGRDWDQEWNR